MTPSYIPASDNEFVVWFDNFRSKIGNYQATFGLTAAEVTSVQHDYTWIAFSVLQVDCFKTEQAERVAYKNLLRDGPPGAPSQPYPSMNTIVFPPQTVVPPGIEPRVRALVQRIKNHPNYTAAIGEDLGVVAPPPPESENPKPTCKVAALPNSEVVVAFKKNGHDAVVVETKRGTETIWNSLGVKMKSPCIDARPPLTPAQPELRFYRMRYVENDQPIGEYSDVLTVTTMP